MNQDLHGIVNVDKLAGMTSMDVVRQVKRLTGHRHVGHGGTLDPAATGVLPVFLGQATRVMEYMIEGDKEYKTTIQLGVETDTYDADGQVTQASDVGDLTLASVEAALQSFRGTIEQIPPMYSALKNNGQRLYKLARQGVEIERQARTVTVKRLEVIEWATPLLTVSLVCSRGFYVRSLAHDLGQSLETGGHIAMLRRIRTGAFHVDNAMPSDQLPVFNGSNWQHLLLPPDYALPHLNTATLSLEEEKQIKNGQPARLSPDTHYAQHMETRRAYNSEGVLVALLRFHRTARLWKPHKVFDLDTPSRFGHYPSYVETP